MVYVLIFVETFVGDTCISIFSSFEKRDKHSSDKMGQIW